MGKNLILNPPVVCTERGKDMTDGMTLEQEEKFYRTLDWAHGHEKNGNYKIYKEVIGELYGKEEQRQAANTAC